MILRFWFVLLSLLMKRVDADGTITNLSTEIGKKVTEPLDQMREAGYRPEMIDKIEADEKIKTRLETINEYVGKNLNEEKQKTAADLVTSVVSGSSKMVEGIQNDDVLAAVTGGLEIAASLIGLAGPVGGLVSTIITTVLPLVSTIFSFFSGTVDSTKKKEDPNFKKIVEKAIEGASLNELKIHLAGVKALYKTVSASVAEFRRQIEDGGVLTTGEGLELYDHAFKELIAFGMLQEVIDKYCEKPDNDDDKDTYAKRCGTFIRLYCSLAIQRQLLLMDVAAVLSNNNELSGTTDNMMFLMKKQLEDDHEFLRFLLDPLNFPERRYAVHCLFDKPQNNRLVILYLKLLKKTFPYYPGFYQPPVIGCYETHLQGACVAFYNNTPAHFPAQDGSLFVPLGVKVTKTVVLGNGDRDRRSEHNANLVLFGPLSHALPINLNHRLLNLTYENTDADASDHVIICGTKEDPATDYTVARQRDLCKVFEGKDAVEYDIGGQFIEVKSVFLPNNISISLLKKDKNVIRRFVGPDYVDRRCEAEDWTNTKWIKIKRTGYLKKVKLCAQTNLTGKCQSVVIPKYILHEPIYDIGQVDSSTHYGCPLDYFKSMKIPQGVEISLSESLGWQNMDYRKGPFVGPIIGNLYANIGWKKLKVYDLIKSPVFFCSDVDLKGHCYQQEPVNGFHDGHYPGVHYPLRSIRVPDGVTVTLFSEVALKSEIKSIVGPKRLTNVRFFSFRITKLIGKRNAVPRHKSQPNTQNLDQQRA